MYGHAVGVSMYRTHSYVVVMLCKQLFEHLTIGDNGNYKQYYAINFNDFLLIIHSYEILRDTGCATFL
jgi:hypothetical protein